MTKNLYFNFIPETEKQSPLSQIKQKYKRWLRPLEIAQVFKKKKCQKMLHFIRFLKKFLNALQKVFNIYKMKKVFRNKITKLFIIIVISKCLVNNRIGLKYGMNEMLTHKQNLNEKKNIFDLLSRRNFIYGFVYI